MTPLATLAVGFVGGVASWFFTSFVGEPVQHFRTLRRAAAARISDLGNVGPPSDNLSGETRKSEWDRLWEARREIRKAAVDLTVFAATQPALTRIAKRLGYDVQGAGANLMGFSNTLHEWGNDRHSFRKAFNKAMKLPGY